MNKKTNAIIILDGYGLSDNINGNAIKKAHTPYLDKLFKEYPNSKLNASGLSVGLPNGQMGNSEVGHLNIGAGRIIYQDITMIDNQIKTSEFFKNDVFKNAMINAKDKALHLIGLCSDGGVHSSLNHLYALIKMANDYKIKNLYMHCITDGRDTSPQSAKRYISQIEDELKKQGLGKIVTVCGRYNIMDRDNRWDRVQKGYNAVFEGEGAKFDCAVKAIENSYQNGIYDEFIEPCIIGDYQGVKKQDSVIFFNFRADRARQITSAAAFENFNNFDRKSSFKMPHYVCMTQYDVNFNNWKNIFVAFPPKNIENTLGAWLAKQGLSQARVAETEKYAHVTFFFDGGIEAPNENEVRVLVDSPKVATYDLMPKMSAFEVANKAVQQIGKVDVLIVNFANCDMVGHTGDSGAAKEAVEEVDMVLEGLVESLADEGGFCLVTSDHGNAECMIDEGGQKMTAHTINKVPLILAGDKFKKSKLKDGKLADIAPTFLNLIGLDVPSDMDGEILID
ncbi:MAG: 2,3-bisphosphoglycerate-independent phosphoglycerate mutase [Firmicutes bacterium]|nr:2,3-bisphosphoglycerate-independent phosphoglycerate mutase [Bacillota bacterium]